MRTGRERPRLWLVGALGVFTAMAANRIAANASPPEEKTPMESRTKHGAPAVRRGAIGPSDWARVVEEVSAEVPEAAPIRLLSTRRFGAGREVAHFEMKNGLRVLVLEDHQAPVVSFQTWFAVGSRHEAPGRTGIAHLFEHLMFKGTKTHPHEVFDRLLEEAGAQTNAATWLDWTFYYENLPADGWGLAPRLESDRMTGLVLNQEQLDSEREVVKNERRFRVENDPDGAMDEALMAMVYGDHPYGHPTLGSMGDLDALSLDDCLGFYRTYYSPSNATIVVVGDVDTREVLETLGRLYGPVPAVEVPRVRPTTPPEQAAMRSRTLTLPVATEKARLAWRAVSADHPDGPALDVVTGILFDNESSRVYRVLVEERGLASDVDGTVEAFALDGIAIADVVLNEGKTARQAVEVLVAEVERLGREGPTPAELERTRNATEAAFLRSLQTAGSKATQLGLYEMTAGDYRLMFEFVDRVRAVTAEDVKRVVGRYLTRDRLNLVVAKPAAGGNAGEGRE